VALALIETRGVIKQKRIYRYKGKTVLLVSDLIVDTVHFHLVVEETFVFL